MQPFVIFQFAPQPGIKLLDFSLAGGLVCRFKLNKQVGQQRQSLLRAGESRVSSFRGLYQGVCAIDQLKV
jgi:hypothetical protein